MKGTQSYTDEDVSLDPSWPPLILQSPFPYLVWLTMILQRIMRKRYPRKKILNPTRTAITLWLKCMGALMDQTDATTFISNPYANGRGSDHSARGNPPGREELMKVLMSWGQRMPGIR
jgi:hypothetical protein